MRAQGIAREHYSIVTQWTSRKSVRLAMLLGALLTVSIAVNAMIILAAGTGA